jgi:hypothetical protein
LLSHFFVLVVAEKVSAGNPRADAVTTKVEFQFLPAQAAGLELSSTEKKMPACAGIYFFGEGGSA